MKKVTCGRGSFKRQIRSRQQERGRQFIRKRSANWNERGIDSSSSFRLHFCYEQAYGIAVLKYSKLVIIQGSYFSYFLIFHFTILIISRLNFLRVAESSKLSRCISTKQFFSTHSSSVVKKYVFSLSQLNSY